EPAPRCPGLGGPARSGSGAREALGVVTALSITTTASLRRRPLRSGAVARRTFHHARRDGLVASSGDATNVDGVLAVGLLLRATNRAAHRTAALGRHRDALALDEPDAARDGGGTGRRATVVGLGGGRG